MKPNYPIYVISKGRWESRLTHKALLECGIQHHVVVEPQEFDKYAAVIPRDMIYVLPFSNLGLGGIPARNWVWDHAKESGAKRHWILDDNIRHFYRLNNSQRDLVKSGITFFAAEQFVDRYQNVALAGMQYVMFGTCTPTARIKNPIILNHRIYSCILILNEIPYRWRGRYNEDTDLSIRVLRDGWCTVLFNAFLCQKTATMRMKGGNTDQLYKEDGRLKMAQSLLNQHPDIVKIKQRWGRWQHVVDYRPFKKNKLVKIPGIDIQEGINEFGMVLKKINHA